MSQPLKKPEPKAWNLFEAEEAIVKRLEFATQKKQGDIEPWCRGVFTYQSLELDDLKQTVQGAPVILVVYNGSMVHGEATRFIEDHRWLVILGLKSAASQRKSADLNYQAGLYLPIIQAALTNYHLPGAVAPLVQLSAPAPHYQSGMGLYSLTFKATTHFSIRFNTTGAVPSNPTDPLSLIK